MGRKLLSLALSLLCLPSNTLSTNSARAAAPVAASRTINTSPDHNKSDWIDVRVSPLFDLYYFARKLAAAQGGPEGYEWLGEAVDATRQLEKDFGGRFTPPWSIIDENLIKCETAAEAVTEFERLPETTQFRGRTFAVREGALRLARALAAAEPKFVELVWTPQHKATVEDAAARVAKVFEPRERKALAFISKTLSASGPARPLAIYLVAESHYPGGFTYLRDDGGTLSVVAVSRNAGTLLYESILHEAIHCLDGVGSGGSTEGAQAGTLLMELRGRLRKAGVAESDLHDAAHLVIFAAAAATVRHVIDKQHTPYAEVAKVYERMPRVNSLAPVWAAYFDGKLTREAALAQSVEKLTSKDLPKIR
ncbi:MAG: hypothetical protein M3268_09220 [Acidobacteriota bacterium]|nr:hypothetical protein [Acidobacteriota bacterium]